ncbi:MAG: hypothetical protein WD895_00550 [Acidimicrobiia bacterium]
MKWSVSLVAEGDRTIELAEVVELADAVAASNGIATGMGTLGYGAQIVVEADSSDQAVDRAMALFTAAADKAGLPPWPITRAETIADEDDLDYGFEDVPEGELSGPAGALE